MSGATLNKHFFDRHFESNVAMRADKATFLNMASTLPARHTSAGKITWRMSDSHEGAKDAFTEVSEGAAKMLGASDDDDDDNDVIVSLHAPSSCCSSVLLVLVPCLSKVSVSIMVASLRSAARDASMWCDR